MKLFILKIMLEKISLLTNIFMTGDQRIEIPVEKYNTLLSIIEERKLKGTYKPVEEEESE